MPLSVQDPLVDTAGHCPGLASLFSADFESTDDILDLTVVDSDPADRDSVDPDAPDLDACMKEIEAEGIAIGESSSSDTESAAAYQAMYQTLTEDSDEKNLIARLIRDNKVIWEALLNNKFCEKMRKARGNDAAVFKGFKWYMVQNVMYCLRVLHFEAHRGDRARLVKNFQKSTTRLAKYAGYTNTALKVCIDAQPKGLGISGPGVLKARRTEEMKRYSKFIAATAQQTNWIMALVALVPCIQSYHYIATSIAKDKTVDKYFPCAKEYSFASGSPWYGLWVEPNTKWGDSVKRQIKFFIDHYEYWKKDYKKASSIFKTACQAEIDLWGVALKPDDVE